jgi:HEAT repeat protein
MATGGIPLPRVGSVACIVALLVGGTFVGPAAAQESAAATKLQKGLELLRAGDRESVAQAITTLREALAADLTSDEALAALAQAEYAGWQALLNLMASGAEGANVAVAILDIATPRLPDKAFQEEDLRAQVKTACEAESYSERFDAGNTLARVYGEFAVPHLLAYLGSSNTDQRINAHITLMNRIGRAAVPPLNVAVRKAGASVRMMVATELGTIGDERSLAAVAEATTDQDSNVRDAATKAFEKLGAKFPWAAGLTAAELHLRLAQLYYRGDYRVMAYTDRPLVLWSWSDRLVKADVPKHLYILKMAEDACYDSLRLDSSSVEARSLLARILASEKVASDAVAPQSEGDMVTAAYAAGLANAEGTVASLGWETLSHALGASLDGNDKTAATFLLKVMPMVYGGSDFTADNAVVRAASDSSAGVRIAAAEAVLRFNATRRVTAFPDPDGFASLVAQAAGEIVPRHILVIDARDERRNKVVTELDRAKFMVYNANTGSDGYILARRLAGLDLVIASPDLTDMEILALQRRLAEDDRTKSTPLLVIGTPEQVANEQWRALFEGKAAGVSPILEGPGLPGEEFLAAVKGAFQGDSPGAADRYRRSASVLDALAKTDTGNALFHWNALTETLSMLLTGDVPDDPPVRLNAIGALGNIGDTAALTPLLGYFGSASDGALRAAAGHAIASICRKNPQALDDGAFQTLLKGTRAGDAGVRESAFAALGAAQLSPAQALACAVANRPGVGSPAGAEEGGGEEGGGEEGGGCAGEEEGGGCAEGCGGEES